MMKSLSVITLAAIIVVSGFMLAGTVTFSYAQTGTSVSGIISQDTTWTKANSPYTLAGNVLVDREVTLTVEPDVTVNFNNYYIKVNGTLRAIGESDGPINFNGGYIDFSSTSINYNEQTGTGCIVENANLSTTSITTNTSPKINHNTILRITINEGSPTISNNTIFSNVGVFFGASPAITNNNILGGISIGDSLPTLISNNRVTGDISGNAKIISYNTVTGKISVGDSSQISNNVVSGGISVGVGSYTISYNTISGADIGIHLPTVFVSSDVYAHDNSVSGCKTAILGDLGSNVMLEKNSITNNEYGIKIQDPVTSTKGSWIIKANQIINNQYAIYGGVTSIEENLIMNNTYGIYGTAVSIKANTIVNNSVGIRSVASNIFNNNIYNNTNYNIYLPSGATNNVNATNNWWGTTNTQTINQTIYDFKNDFNLGKVNFVPFLTEPNPQAPIAPTVLPTPTIEPTATPSTQSPSSTSLNPSSSPSQYPTVSPNQPSPQTESNQAAILIGLIIVIVVLITVAVLRFKKKRQ
jgi:hypothetical protein